MQTKKTKNTLNAKIESWLS